MRRKVLIVDDDPDILMLLSVVLEDAGFGAVLASDGVNAMERFQEEQPDLVVLGFVLNDLYYPYLHKPTARRMLDREPSILLHRFDARVERVRDVRRAVLCQYELHRRVRAALLARGGAVRPGEPPEREDGRLEAFFDLELSGAQAAMVLNSSRRGAAEMKRRVIQKLAIVREI